jgi:hypothetical protein
VNVLKKMCRAIYKTEMPEENKKILQRAVLSRMEELAAQTDGNGVAAAARKIMTAAQDLIPKATVEKKKRKSDKEKMMEDDKAFVKQSIEIFYADGEDPTPQMIMERAEKMGYPVKAIDNKYYKEDAIDLLEKEGVVYKAGFNEKSQAVYLPKGQKPHGQLREKPISMNEIMERSGKGDDRIPLPEKKECEIKVENDHVIVDGARIPKNYIDKKINSGRAMSFVQVFSNELERYGGDIGKEEMRELGYWLAKEIWPGKDESFYTIEVMAESVKIARRTKINETKRQTPEDIRKEAKKRGVSE